MKRFADESRASSSSNTSATLTTNAISRQSDAVMDNATTPDLRCWHNSHPNEFHGYLPLSRTPSTSQNELIVLYTVDNLCKDRDGRLAMAYLDVLPCISSVLHPHRPLMSECLLALAKVFYGLKNRERGILGDGIALYGRGLRGLHTSFSKGSGGVSIETVIAVLSLAVTEVRSRPSYSSTSISCHVVSNRNHTELPPHQQVLLDHPHPGSRTRFRPTRTVNIQLQHCTRPQSA